MTSQESHNDLTVWDHCDLKTRPRYETPVRSQCESHSDLTLWGSCESHRVRSLWRFILWNSVMSQCEVTVISRCETVLGSFLGSFQVASLACFLLSYTTNWYKTQSLIRIQMELLTATWNQCKTDLKVTSSNLNVNNACKSKIEADLAFKKPIYLYLSIQN